MLTDSFGRTIDYLRVSVTDRCNLRCQYCMPEGGIPLLAHEDVLRFEEVAAVVRVAVEAGLRSVRITGGEPLVKRGIERLLTMLRSIEGLQDLSMTTNGVLLAGRARALREAGLQRINIGIPSLDPATYRTVTRCAESLESSALEGVQAALEAGLHPVKINTVVMRGLNDDITPLLSLVKAHPLELRFIEYMPIGPSESSELFVSATEIEQRIRQAAWAPLAQVTTSLGNGPAQVLYRIGDSPGVVGVIPAMTEHFCARCNRLRLTSEGTLRTCLFSDDEVDLKPALRPTPDLRRLNELMRAAVSTKPACLPLDPKRGRRLMGQIGG